ncbi:hypothetical protein [Vibrio diabolicus]|nr:hypothetical protein [Vibrio diabolicus]
MKIKKVTAEGEVILDDSYVPPLSIYLATKLVGLLA